MAAVATRGPEIPTGTGRERLMQLAQPKEHKMVWITSCGDRGPGEPLGSYDDQRWNFYTGFDKRERKIMKMGDLHPPDPRVTWGTQETLWPVPKGALAARCSGRLIDLSQPKKNFQTGDNLNRPEFMYSCGRSSVIWNVSPGAIQANPSERVQVLAEHKQTHPGFNEDRPHFVFSCGRSSPIWKVPRNAKSCASRSRTESLAQPKPVHPAYSDNRGVQTQIPPAALRSSASGRIESLAVAKSRPEGPFREPQWPVSHEAKKASPSGRSVELSKPKSVPDGYIPARDVIWPVSRAARKTQTTTRLDELANPIVRASMDHVQFDPNAFVVKESALKGRCTRRIEELAQPLQR